MSDPKLISPMLDNFIMGDPISDHNGVRSCPAMDEANKDKYIVKIISTPSSQSQLDALLLTGAYSDKEEALGYFQAIADGIVDEAAILEKLATLEGFTAFEAHQIVPMDDGNGYDVYLLSTYKSSLDRLFRKGTLTHLGALNLGMDLCSALTACRRIGYLYVNLKPENVYITADNGYRIGDLGFIHLDSLKYASLPDRYRSTYTAPEISDAFSALNTTMDVFATGLILYQAFNGGILPEIDPNSTLPSPDYADYEMSEIILKACNPDPSLRWKDPAELGQALVAYMQRNGANDTPIIPVCSPAPQAESEGLYEENGESIESEDDLAQEVNDETPVPETTPESIDDAVIIDETEETKPAPQSDNESEPEASIYTMDDFGNLTFITDTEDETLPGADPEDMDYGQVSVEVSDMLNQADELIAHPTPQPVVAPDPIDVPIPPPIILEDTENNEVVENESLTEDTEIENVTDDEAEDTASIPVSGNNEDAYPEQSKKKKIRWLPITIILALIASLLAACIYYYQNHYLQVIESIVLEGNETDLTVYVNSKTDESLLTIECSDSYGNKLHAPVKDGKAVFIDLSPSSAYTVKVRVDGFHRLTGNVYAAYTTPARTSITDFTAITGQKDGSVILRFTTNGPDSTLWKITYVTPSENMKEIVFSGHMVEISGLTAGKEYDFELTPIQTLYFYGTNKLSYTASNLILAENLNITSLGNSKVTIQWSEPNNVSVESWTVRCYNSKGYDMTVATVQPTVTFDKIVETDSYIIEVTAAGMSVNQRLYIAENSIAVSDFKISSLDKDKTILSWVPSSSASTTNWILSYTVDDSPALEVTGSAGNSIQLPPLAPGGKYSFVLKAADGSQVIGGILYYTVPNAGYFEGYGNNSSTINASMFITPDTEDWDYNDIPDSDFTTKFRVGQKASFLMYLQLQTQTSNDLITIMYVTKNSAGKIISVVTEAKTWSEMWDNRYGIFNLTDMPDTSGTYQVGIYFNGAMVKRENFSIVD